MNAYSPADDLDRQWDRHLRNSAIAHAVRAGVTLASAIGAMNAAGDLQSPLYPDITAVEARTDFLAWVQERAQQAADDAEDARRTVAEVAELRALISR